MSKFQWWSESPRRRSILVKISSRNFHGQVATFRRHRANRAAPLSRLPGHLFTTTGIALFARARHLATGHFAGAYTHSLSFPLSPFARGGSTDRLTLTVPVLSESYLNVATWPRWPRDRADSARRLSKSGKSRRADVGSDFLWQMVETEDYGLD